MEALLDQPVAPTLPRSSRVAGWLLSGFAVAFLTFDSVIKLIHIQPVTDTFAQMGIPDHLAPVIGTIEALCVALYAHPRTSALGVVLLTGFLGGAVFSHVRIGSPLPTHTLFPLYVAAFLWGGLLLRRPELTALLGLRR
jgi:hypothetical protein